MDRRTFLRSVGTAGIMMTVGGGGMALGRSRERVAANAASASRSSAALAQGRAEAMGSFRTLYSADVTSDVVALSFDDGPDPRFTGRILDILEAKGVSATFFMMGHNVAAHPDLALKVVRAGHDVANHTWTHLDLSKLTPERTDQEIRVADELIRRHTGASPTLFRPPRGRMNGAAFKTIARLDYDLAMWSITGSVRGIATADRVAESVLRNLHPGGIINFHDGIGRGTFNPAADFAIELAERRNAEIDALSDIIDRGRAAGYEFVTIAELLRQENEEAATNESSQLREDLDEVEGY